MDDLFDSSDDEAPAPTTYNTYPRTEELECMWVYLFINLTHKQEPIYAKSASLPCPFK
jgi:hypothetical protein